MSAENQINPGRGRRGGASFADAVSLVRVGERISHFRHRNFALRRFPLRIEIVGGEQLQEIQSTLLFSVLP